MVELSDLPIMQARRVLSCPYLGQLFRGLL